MPGNDSGIIVRKPGFYCITFKQIGTAIAEQPRMYKFLLQPNRTPALLPTEAIPLEPLPQDQPPKKKIRRDVRSKNTY